MQSRRLFVYFDIEPLPAAWAAYRGQMCSAASIGTSSFRPIAYWPYGLLKGAAAGDLKKLSRLEKEFALEKVRREYYPTCVSRLHGIYMWESEEDAIRCEAKWRPKEGQYFDRQQLVEVGFTYSNLTRVDTQWIDHFVLANATDLDQDNLAWTHAYWRGEPFDSNPHWEVLVEGRGIIWGTELRMRALRRIEDHWQHLTGQLELARLALGLGSDLYNLTPFVFRLNDETVRVDFCIDGRDENDSFMQRLGEYMKTLEKSAVNWRAVQELGLKDQFRPNLRQEGFEFSLNCLSLQGRAAVEYVLSSRDGITWSGETSFIV
jgi:hypothetical protein